MSAPAGRRVRTAIVRGVAYLPQPVRRTLWRTHRRRARAQRRALEARGNFSRSRPAMHDMDAKLARHIDIEGGFFVEAGANDGYDQSNTYWLAKAKGWRGVLVEPVPTLDDDAVEERPESRVYNCALVPFDYDAPTVTLRYGGR